MKMKDLINLIDLEIEKCVLYEDFKKSNCLKVIKDIIKKSRTRQEFISIISKSYTKSVIIHLLCTKIDELEKRITHEKMFFEKYSDTKDMIEMYNVKLNFYKMLLLDVKEV